MRGKINGICDRCNLPNDNKTTMSMFNTDVICMTCKEEEKNHPEYKNASDAELSAWKERVINFEGIGLPKDLKLKYGQV